MTTSSEGSQQAKPPFAMIGRPDAASCTDESCEIPSAEAKARTTASPSPTLVGELTPIAPE